MAGIKMQVAHKILDAVDGESTADALAVLLLVLASMAHKYGVRREILLEAVGEIYDKWAERGAN